MKKSKMKIILAGTPQFCKNIFNEIINHFDVVAIITQHDKPSGRGMSIRFSPIKELSIENNILLLQPKRISDIKEKLKELKSDLLITCAYGQYIPTNILAIPKYNSINIHASLLPRHRGPAPIQYSILSNDKYAGITIMRMTKEMDRGDILFKKKILIGDNTSKDLFSKLSLIAEENIIKWIKRIFNNEYTSTIQDDTKATYSYKINKKDSEIKDSDTVKYALLKMRAFHDFPGTFINYKNIKLKIFKAYDNYHDNSIVFKLSDGYIYITQVQIPGKKKINSYEYLNGAHNA